MSKRSWYLVTVALLLIEVSLAHANAGDADGYELLIERNIFSPTRGERSDPMPPREQRPEPEPRETRPRDPGRAMVLRGFAVRGEQAVAMIEAAAGTMQRVGVGDTVAGRRITAIAIDRLEYEHDGEQKAIGVGMTLTGEAAPRSDRQAGGGRAAGERDNAAASSSGDRNALLERMRRRRQQIVGGASPVEAEHEPREPERETFDEMPIEADEDADVADFDEADEALDEVEADRARGAETRDGETLDDDESEGNEPEADELDRDGSDADTFESNEDATDDDEDDDA